MFIKQCLTVNSTAHMRRHEVTQWFRHCTTNQKVTGSIPDGAIGIFH
jgi:hypothetical protein